MADDIDDAQSDMDEQAKWGFSRTDMAVVKVVRSARILVTRLKALEDRVKALEGTK